MPQPNVEVSKLIDVLFRPKPEAELRARALRELARLRSDASLSAAIDERISARAHELAGGLAAAQHHQGELEALLEKIADAPWHPARFERLVDTDRGPRALVQVGDTRRLVAFSSSFEQQLAMPGAADALCRGCAVFLDQSLSLLVALDSDAPPEAGALASFERWLDPQRMVVRDRDEPVVLDAGAALEGADLERGDLLRVNRHAQLALERIAPGEERGFVIASAPEVGPELLGGQRESLELLIGTLAAGLVDPELAKRYRVDGRRAILLCGPPGCGKTLIARIAAAAIQRVSGRRCSFAVVKPGEFRSPYVGETERAIRDCFAALRRASGRGLAILFLDEIETLGRLRGGIAQRHSDDFLATLLAELDGFRDRGEIALIAATNRRDLLDPAIASRFADCEIEIGRPGAEAARAILEIHLPAELPFRPNGKLSSRTRSEAIEVLVSKLYAPNAGGALCSLLLRDGSRRSVAASELVSGRLLEQLALRMRSAALRRELDGGEAGIGVEDALAAAESAREQLAALLSPGNARAWLTDLPQDLDVMAVERAPGPGPAESRYLEVEGF